MYYKSSILILNCQHISRWTVQIISFYYQIRRYHHKEPPIWTPLSSGRLQNKIEFIKKIKWTIRFIKIHVLFGIYQSMQMTVLNILTTPFTCSRTWKRQFISSMFTQLLSLLTSTFFLVFLSCIQLYQHLLLYTRNLQRNYFITPNFSLLYKFTNIYPISL